MANDVPGGGDNAPSAEHEELGAEHEELIALANQVMPFGKYKGELLLNLPEPYLVWFHGEGFPDSKLGWQMATMYEVKVNGLEKLLRPLVRADGLDEDGR